MKTLLIAAEKGGAGRSALLCQFAHYLCRVRSAGVLLLDLAGPACSTASLTCAGRAVVSGGERAFAISHRKTAWVRAPRIQVLPWLAVRGLSSVAGESSARYYANMQHLLHLVGPFVDVCLIDSPPLPDPRAVCAEANADAMLSPIVLSRESFDSADDLINGPHGLRNVRARLNSARRFFGLLPNMVEDTPLQQAMARATFRAQLGARLIPDPRDSCGYLHMPRLDVIAQAQAAGLSVPDLARGNATARMAWRPMRNCFDAIALRLDWIGSREPWSGAQGEPGANMDPVGAVHV